MMKNSYAEYICDYCGNAEHFLCNVRGKVRTEKTARDTGWIITADGKHFDTKECYHKYKKGISE